MKKWIYSYLDTQPKCNAGLSQLNKLTSLVDKTIRLPKQSIRVLCQYFILMVMVSFTIFAIFPSFYQKILIRMNEIDCILLRWERFQLQQQPQVSTLNSTRYLQHCLLVVSVLTGNSKWRRIRLSPLTILLLPDFVPYVCAKAK